MSVPDIQSGHEVLARDSGQFNDSPVRVGPMVNIARVLSELGEQPDIIFQRAGLSADLYSDPDNRVTYLPSGRLFAECASATGCDYFGLLVGQASQPSHLGLAGFLLRSAETVGDALESFVEYLDLHDEGGTPELNRDGEYSLLSFHVHQPGVDAVDQIYDLCAAVMHNIMKSLCGDEWTATEVMLPRRRPTDTVPYRRLFKTVVLFDTDICAVSFPSDLLDRVSPSADSLLHRHLVQEARARHRMQEKKIRDVLPAVIRHGLLTESFSAKEIAEMLGLGERTFHRRLKAADTNFRKELDQERKTVSLQLLECTSLPVGSIAQSLGYADTSSFNRAFRRWTGRSPTAWRNSQRASG